MSKDKYATIYLPQMEAIVFIILQIILKQGRSVSETFSESNLTSKATL